LADRITRLTRLRGEKGFARKRKTTRQGNVIKLMAAVEDGAGKKTSTTETLCSFSVKRERQKGRRSLPEKSYAKKRNYAIL